MDKPKVEEALFAALMLLIPALAGMMLQLVNLMGRAFSGKCKEKMAVRRRRRSTKAAKPTEGDSE